MTDPKPSDVRKEACLCGHSESCHDPEQDGECVEVCACAGYTTNPEDSNLSHTARLKKARAAALEEAARLVEEAFDREDALRGDED